VSAWFARRLRRQRRHSAKAGPAATYPRSKIGAGASRAMLYRAHESQRPRPEMIPAGVQASREASRGAARKRVSGLHQQRKEAKLSSSSQGPIQTRALVPTGFAETKKRATIRVTRSSGLAEAQNEQSLFRFSRHSLPRLDSEPSNKAPTGLSWGNPAARNCPDLGALILRSRRLHQGVIVFRAEEPN
jgi:hypothetical protein